MAVLRILTLLSVPVLVLGRLSGKDVINDDGSINENYEFKNGKYFQKTKDTMGAMSGTPAQWYTQCYDHAGDPTCRKTWQQRYWINREYNPNGLKNVPIFFYLGNEGPADGWVDGGNWLTVGGGRNAIFVALEHRFYGESYPTKDETTAGLKVHTSQQALADASRFIKWIKQMEGLHNSKVMCMGGSYGGNLAAWFREKYPGECNVAWSSSGPLNATFDMPQYMKTVSEVIYYINSECYNALANTFYCMQNIVAGIKGCSASVTAKEDLPAATRYCDGVNFANKRSTDSYYYSMAMNVWGSNWPAKQDKPLCEQFLARYKATNDAIAAYGQFLGDRGRQACSPDNRRKRSAQIMDENTDGKMWQWQTCNEMGYYQSSDPTYCAFGCHTWGPEYLSWNCRYYWQDGPFTDDYIKGQVVKTNAHYMSNNNPATCVVYIHGSYDPWHELGTYQQSQTNSKNTVIFIPTGEHCDDMDYSSTNPQVTAAQAKIKTAILKYLDDPTC